jgi:glutamate---cysteine ligase / carboxylate-amine ligase
MWRASDPYTVGIEEEVMLLDPHSWKLEQRAGELLSGFSEELSAYCSTETHEAALELRTGIHATVPDAIAQLGALRRLLTQELGATGLAAAACGAYPGQIDEPTKISSGGRAQLVDRTMRELAHREPTFALHVHVGVPEPHSAIRLLNRLRTQLPLLLALSASSPFWRGYSTGLASIRTILFQAFPRTGVPRSFDSYADWAATVDVLVSSGAIPEPTFLWWDIRPQPSLGTVEVRIMDSQPGLRATAALCALVQALARLELEQGFASAPSLVAHEVLSENRFLAARDGAGAALIDPANAVRVPLRALLADVLAAVRPHAARLGAAEELAGVDVLAQAPEATRQEALVDSAGIAGLLGDLCARFGDHADARAR